MNEKPQYKPHPGWIAIQAFAVAILVGTVLLVLPWSRATKEWTDPVTALFTSTSATCVTGLIVEDTGTHFSAFGQLVILLLMQLGGLGIMTLGTFLLVLSGRRLRMQDESVLRDSLGAAGVHGLRSLLARALLFTVVLEAAGAAILAYRLHGAHGYPLPRAVYYGTFHAVSAFCNAGFSLYTDSLAGLRGDPVVLATVMALIVLGGLGFLVLYNITSVKFWRRDRLARGRLTLHTRMVLATSTILLLTGALLFCLLEFGHSLAAQAWPGKLLCSLFHSITPRTAGFNVVDVGELRPATRLLTMLLMFVGGSPGSTAGGIKTTTLLVLLATAVAMVRGRQETELRGRTVPMKVVREALAIFTLSFVCVLVFFFVLLLTESRALSGGDCASDALLFETVSAFGTVGLSTGVTGDLSVLGRLCVVVCMFVGRLGPLTIALVIGSRDLGQAVRYPEEEVVVG